MTRVIGGAFWGRLEASGTVEVVLGGHMGNPNPLKQAYTCQTCGRPRPPYQFYCDKHLEVGEKSDKPLLIDRLMRKILGRS